LTKKIEEKERALRIGREKALQQTTQLSNKVKGKEKEKDEILI